MGYYEIHLKDYRKSCEKLWDIMKVIEGLQEISWEVIMGYYERITGNFVGSS